VISLSGNPAHYTWLELDPYLTASCKVALDVVASQRESLEKVQHYYLRGHMLGLQSRSMCAVLFSETGLLPIRFRRVTLALQYLLYLLSLPPERLVHRAMVELHSLARLGRGSWFTHRACKPASAGDVGAPGRTAR